MPVKIQKPLTTEQLNQLANELDVESVHSDS